MNIYSQIIYYLLNLFDFTINGYDWGDSIKRRDISLPSDYIDDLKNKKSLGDKKIPLLSENSLNEPKCIYKIYLRNMLENLLDQFLFRLIL